MVGGRDQQSTVGHDRRTGLPVRRLVDLCLTAAAGDVAARTRAAELTDALAVLSTYDEGPDLVLYYKYLMLLEGNPEYALHFNASDALSASQQHYAKQQLALFKTWFAGWSQQG